ncbi:hypothetical protein WN51_11221 [Melipona quadrifasciata]|uniref:Uncharacterized protein n=1 Tax=Melipona quadrifasciata TaxID=166423 RepID=A0A0N0BHR2_9HYME|nr:hypothetical protein WN51_11221 [Melipona quadrifasciata]
MTPLSRELQFLTYKFIIISKKYHPCLRNLTITIVIISNFLDKYPKPGYTLSDIALIGTLKNSPNNDPSPFVQKKKKKKSTTEGNSRFRNLKQRGEKKRRLKGATIIQQRAEPSATKDFVRQMSYERSLALYTPVPCNPGTTKRNSSNLSQNNALLSSRDSGSKKSQNVEINTTSIKVSSDDLNKRYNSNRKRKEATKLGINFQRRDRPRIPQIRVSNTRLAQAASGCAPSVDVLPIFDVKQQSVRNPALGWVDGSLDSIFQFLRLEPLQFQSTKCLGLVSNGLNLQIRSGAIVEWWILYDKHAVISYIV